MTNSIPRRKCFLALFDLLGFKDLVKSYRLEDVYKAYQDILRASIQMKGHVESLLGHEIVTVRNYSDTFLIYTVDINGQNQKDIDKIFLALLAVCESLFYAANEHRLPIRGTITAGELIVSIDIESSIEIGTPIVDAYEKEQAQEWIGCLVTKDCINLISEEAVNDNIKDNSIVEYEIPLKNGKVDKVYAFNWVKSEPFRSGDFRLLEKRSWHDWAIERKHRNTWDFIKYIQQRSESK